MEPIDKRASGRQGLVGEEFAGKDKAQASVGGLVADAKK
jgi:hypothetical protein